MVFFWAFFVYILIVIPKNPRFYINACFSFLLSVRKCLHCCWSACLSQLMSLKQYSPEALIYNKPISPLKDILRTCLVSCSVPYSSIRWSRFKGEIPVEISSRFPDVFRLINEQYGLLYTNQSSICSWIVWCHVAALSSSYTF